MCGIYGQYNSRGADPALIERMAQCLDHRGPDGYGTYNGGVLAFGAGRLAIIDLNAGVQPIFNEDRRIAVVFNGEIYNFKALRKELEAAVQFSTHTDTVVIVHGYEAWGIDVLQHLRGMFALAIWDSERERLLLARDRLGEKPLYYTQIDNEIVFASEIKALFEHPYLRRAVDHEALISYMALGHVPPPRTMFAGINKVAPGERIVVERGKISVQRYWELAMDTTVPMPFDTAVQELRHSLNEVVAMQMVSDVPVGAFLSGGVDSSAVVALMGRASGQPVTTFTVGYDYPDDRIADNKFNVDTRYADLVARHLHTEHHLIKIREDESLATLLPHLIYALDEPVAQTAIVQTAYVAALTRVMGIKVALHGSAGDELFLGYDHYRTDRVVERYLQIPEMLRQNLLTPLLERVPGRFDRIKKLVQKSRATQPGQRYLGWLRNIELSQVADLLSANDEQDLSFSALEARLEAELAPLLATPKTRHFADRLSYAEMRLTMPEESNMCMDKMSMAMSIESRSPLLDFELVKLAMRIPLEDKLRNGEFKAVFKHAVEDLIPDAVLNRRKWGFFAPVSKWLRGGMKPLMDTYLSPEYIGQTGIFNLDVVANLIEDHLSKRSYNMWALWSLLTFQIWYAEYIDGSLKLDHTLTPSEVLSTATIESN